MVRSICSISLANYLFSSIKKQFCKPILQNNIINQGSIRLSFLMLLLIFSGFYLKAQTSYQSIPAGSYIIDMGITPQTYANGLKPYGLVYGLIQQYNIPVKWSINPSKSKDGIDFTVDGHDYKGGPFIIDAWLRTPTVDAYIASWEAKGVVGYTTTTPVTVPVFEVLKYFPVWTLDLQNGSLVLPAFENSEIPTTAYNFCYPTDLDCCNDIFILPHADPTWGNHRNLYFWNAAIDSGGCAGWIWSACHGVSALENLSETDDYENHGDTLLNFLTTDGAVLWGDHDDGTPPYTYEFPTDPNMQFMGIFDGATENGSEQIYMPQKGLTNSGNWRTTTKAAVYDPDHPDYPALTMGKAAKLAFGPAYGEYNRGMVMYEAGHKMTGGTEAQNVAAQRAFFNFCFQAPGEKAPKVIIQVPDVIVSGTDAIVNCIANSPLGSSVFTFEWSASCSGTFANPYAQITLFTPDTVTDLTDCVITCVANDVCGRSGFDSKVSIITPPPYPPNAVNDTASTPPYLPVLIEPLANDTDQNLDSLVFSAFIGNPVIAGVGTFLDNGDGTVTFTPDVTYTGTTSIDYIVCDTTGLCDTAKIVVVVTYPDTDGDGLADNIDIDDDNDGIRDIYDNIYGGTVDPSGDADLDGYPNFADVNYPGWVDSNNDGVNDNFDFDLDGIPDHLDLDSDNDGIPDLVEAGGNASVLDVNSDGRVDWTNMATDDTNNDGLIDVVDGANGGTYLAVPNTDGLGYPNFIDRDSDGDGLTDATETGGTDANGDGIIDGFADADGDGMNDSGNVFSPVNTDAGTPTGYTDTFADYIDIDADNDGIVDNIEGQTTAAYTALSGNDADNDGIDDAYDPNQGGTAIVLSDWDGDNTPDYIDSDSDDDSVPDNIEGHDVNSDGYPDWSTVGATVT